MYTVESKSLLAKLMATENITVEHQSKAKTARFNMQTRVLTCPIWRDMDGDLYDLLMGHEISHALRTPLEGWHDSVVYAGGNTKATLKEQKAFKHFLNVVEDARIEKLVKRQYPGLRNPMFKGYKDLLARDFFGLSRVKNLDDLYLIDKLNLAAKVGVLLNVQFTAKEQPFYDEMQNLETFDDVLTLTRKLYAYSKIEQQEQKQAGKDKKKLKEEKNDQEDRDKGDQQEQDQDSESDGQEGDSDEEGSETSEGEEGDSDEEGDEGETQGTSGDEDEENDSSDSDEDGDSGEGESEGDSSDEDNSEDENGNPGGQGTGGEEEDDLDENFVPQAKTDETFRRLEERLVDNGEVRSVYINIPTPNLQDVVTPAVIVNSGLNSYYSTRKERDHAHGLFTAFKAKNEDYVSLLAKEFEMRKAARSFNRSRHAETGDININKLASYRVEDNIFKKLMIVQKGKSHGLVLLLDRSSSMQLHIEAATEQIMIMALFCRKVNIPFVAYAFSDNSGRSVRQDFGARADKLKPFSTNENEFLTMDIGFREILNSSMQAAEFNHSIENQLMLARELGAERMYGTKKAFASTEPTFGFPGHEDMGSTPLNEAIIIMREIVRQFKRKHRLDIVNAIVVHDGDSDRNYAFHGSKKPYVGDKYGRTSIPEEHRFDTQFDRVTIRDKKENVDFVCPKNNRGLQTALLSWFQATSGCGVFGFYITGNIDHRKEALEKMYVNKLGVPLGTIGAFASANSEKMLLLGQLLLKLSNEKFLESYSSGYTRFYFIPGEKELAADNGELLNTASSGKWTPNRLLAAFKKISKKRVVSRVLVSRFIELIASH